MAVKRYGTAEDGKLKYDRMPARLRQRIDECRCFLNLNQVWDFYQARGIEATIRAIDNDERNVLQQRQADDKFLVYSCGHRHETFTEAQRCLTWFAMQRNERPKPGRAH